MKTAFLFILILVSGITFAQDNPVLPKKTNSQSRYISAGFSAIAYKGSLQTAYSRWTPSYHLGISLEKKKLFSSFFGLGFGNYIGEDRTYKLSEKADQNLQPSASFQSSFFTLHYEARFLIFKYGGIRLHACQGIGLFRFTVKDKSGNNLAEKPRSRASGETYSQNSFFFPSSLMLRYEFPNQMWLGFQAGWYNTSSNYLDNMNQLAINKGGDNLASMRFHFSIPLR